MKETNGFWPWEHVGCGQTAPVQDRIAVGWPSGPQQPGPNTSLPRSVAEILRDHVTFEVEGIDRTYLNVSVPQLQRERGVVSSLWDHRGHLFASSSCLPPSPTPSSTRLKPSSRTRASPC